VTYQAEPGGVQVGLVAGREMPHQLVADGIVAMEHKERFFEETT
jgi:hypothetical protein